MKTQTTYCARHFYGVPLHKCTGGPFCKGNCKPHIKKEPNGITIEPEPPIDDGSCDPLYGQRMDSADMGEN